MDVLTAAYRALGFDDLAEGVQVAAAEMDPARPDQPAAPRLFQDESMEVPPSPTDAPARGGAQPPRMPGPGAM